MSLLILCGCSIAFPGSGNPTEPISEECPEKPEIALISKNVKPISLSEKTIVESGITSKSKSRGYTFDAQAGQKLNYQANQAICVWLYTPDNQLLTSGVLPKTGKYTIQVSAPKGSTTFDLTMSLETPQLSSPSPVKPRPSNSETSPEEAIDDDASERPAADNFVENYYISINNRQYSDTWDKLSPNFKKISGSYSGYQQWWNSVKEIIIGDIQVVNQRSDTAIVEAELWYLMKNGRKIKDSKNRIYLIWSSDSNSWLFERKSAP